jgi:hypothetical protein
VLAVFCVGFNRYPSTARRAAWPVSRHGHAWKEEPAASNPSSQNQSGTENKTGTAPSPKGVFMQVWSVFPEDYDYDSCNNTGGVLVELPKINPGKVKT